MTKVKGKKVVTKVKGKKVVTKVKDKKVVASIESFGTMGTWKKKIFDRKGKRSATTSKPGRIYIAIPPEEGWPGGDPLKNGYKRSGAK